jgi:hypothetical protein
VQGSRFWRRIEDWTVESSYITVFLQKDSLFSFSFFPVSLKKKNALGSLLCIKALGASIFFYFFIIWWPFGRSCIKWPSAIFYECRAQVCAPCPYIYIYIIFLLTFLWFPFSNFFFLTLFLFLILFYFLILFLFSSLDFKNIHLHF